MSTAVSLRKWKIISTTVLVLPSQPPHFNVDDFIAAEVAKEKERQEHPEAVEAEPVEVATDHEHLISFAARCTLLISTIKLATISQK